MKGKEMLKTEMRDPATTHIDTVSTVEMVDMLQTANEAAAAAVGEVRHEIAAVIDAVAPRMAVGGRLFYIGCGTSGRLGVLDASECPPTYGIAHGVVVGIIAGGDGALRKASEGAEDDAAHGEADLAAYEPNAQDTVIGLSVAGGAQYVLGAMKKAKACGCLTVGITCNRGSLLDTQTDLSICPDTGAEPITGSTRMKAGTAQKMILNMISTGVMVRQGKVMENLMVNVRPTNIKLKDRCIRIVRELTGADDAAITAAMDACNWDIRTAVQTLKEKQ